MVYNVADIAPFVTALSVHAINRVVVELTLVHPSVALAPLWQHFWNLPRPDGPSSELFLDVVADLGYEAVTESEARPVNKATSYTRLMDWPSQTIGAHFKSTGGTFPRRRRPPSPRSGAEKCCARRRPD